MKIVRARTNELLSSSVISERKKSIGVSDYAAIFRRNAGTLTISIVVLIVVLVVIVIKLAVYVHVAYILMSRHRVENVAGRYGGDCRSKKRYGRRDWYFWQVPTRPIEI